MMALPTLDYLIERAVAAAELEAGQPAALVAARSTLPLALCAFRQPARKAKSPAWSQPEEAFLAESLGRLTEDDIARRLGRTPVAVRLRWKRLRLPAPSKHPDYLTARKAADLLGIDVHKVAGWGDYGILPGDLMAGKRRIRRIHKTALKRWLVRPESWVYFDYRKICDSRLRRLVELALARWGDEWWSVRQVADYHHAETKDVQRYIYRGELPAIQAINQGGRGQAGWSFWYVRKSDALKLIIRRGRGAGHDLPHNPAADAYLLLGRAIGLSTNALAHRLGQNAKQVSYRLAVLRRQGEIPALIERYKLPVAYDPATGALFADWRECPGKFPRLERAIARFLGWLNGMAKPPARPDCLLVANVLRCYIAPRCFVAPCAWAEHIGSPAVARILGGRQINPKNLERAYNALRTQGCDPLQPYPKEGGVYAH